jgi:hypothetical protein
VLELPAELPNGAYCLRISADPLGLIEESNEDDNASARAIRISGNRLRVGPDATCT